MSESQVAILNYHRIVPDGSQAHFYDIAESAFAAQMEALAARRQETVDGAVRLPDGRLVYTTFDDGTDDHHRAARVLSDLGLYGVFFVVTGKLGDPGRLTERQVEQMEADGHRIGSHTVTHARLPEATDEDLTAELVQSKETLEKLLGTTVDWLAPPGGLFDSRVIAAATEAGYRVIRTMEWGYAVTPLQGRVPTLPVIPTYDLAGFGRLLDGRAPLWRYRLKTGLKNLVGEDRYVRMRDSAFEVLRRRP